MIKSGFSFVEIIISVLALAVMTLAIANFSADIFQVSYDHSHLISNTDQKRLASELISTEVSKAGYIFPAGKSISLSGSNFSSVTINTDNALAMLIPSDLTVNPPTYIMKAFYLVDNANGKADLYEFTSSTDIPWILNTIPGETFTTNTGTSSRIATDIDSDNCSLNYILNSGNGTTDYVLQGSVSGVTTASSTALIKGVNWTLVIHKNQSETFNIEGVSNNVPRFFEQI